MRRQTFRNPLFRRRRFADDVIIFCVRWYLLFKLSYRDMAEVAWELGVLVAPSTILRWVVRYADKFSQLWRPLERPVGKSWRCDESISRLAASGCIYTAQLTSAAAQWNLILAARETSRVPKLSFGKL
jgi:transposase-like protein